MEARESTSVREIAIFASRRTASPRRRDGRRHHRTLYGGERGQPIYIIIVGCGAQRSKT